MIELMIKDVYGNVLIPWMVGILFFGVVLFCLAIAIDNWLLNKLGKK
jgi:hypothetical protein